MNSELTYRQYALMAYIFGYWVQNGVTPSVEEMVGAMDWCSTKGAKITTVLNSLVRLGYLRSAKNRVRAYTPKRDLDGTPIELIVRRMDGTEILIGEAA